MLSVSLWQSTLELWSVICCVGCHLMQISAYTLTPARHTGTRFTYTGWVESWVDFGVGYMVR